MRYRLCLVGLTGEEVRQVREDITAAEPPIQHERLLIRHIPVRRPGEQEEAGQQGAQPDDAVLRAEVGAGRFFTLYARASDAEVAEIFDVLPTATQLYCAIERHRSHA